jgi:uncharacterized delta-60 repeat protein
MKKILLLPLLMLLQIATYSQAGRLDLTFGTNGTVLTPADGVVNYEAIAIQPDGKIVIAGSMRLRSGYVKSDYFEVARYNPDGSPDGGFGYRGRTGVVLRAGYGWANALATYGNDGSLDSSVSKDGFHSGELTGIHCTRGSSLLVLTNGKISIAGRRSFSL